MTADVARPGKKSNLALILIGIATFWPAIYFVVFVSIFVAAVMATEGPVIESPALIFILHGLTMVEMLAITVFYAVDEKTCVCRPGTDCTLVEAIAKASIRSRSTTSGASASVSRTATPTTSRSRTTTEGEVSA